MRSPATRTAIEQFESYVGDPVGTIDEALAETPSFVAGHLLKGLVLYTLAERRFAAMAKEALDGAQRSHVAARTTASAGCSAAGDALVDGRWDDACAALDRVLANDPRDALALQTAHLMDFYRGDALNLRNRVSRVLPHWDASVPGLLVRPRHARVRPRGDEPVPGGGGDRAARACRSSRRTGGPSTPPCT